MANWWNPGTWVDEGTKAVERAWTEGKKTVSHAVNEFGKKTGQVTTDVWTHGGREAVLIGAGTAAAILTGGAALGAVGLLEGGAAAVAGTAAIAGGVAGAAAGYQGAVTETAKEEQAKAEAEYAAEVNKANAVAERNRRANLLSLRKSLTPSLSKSSQGGQGAADMQKEATGGIVLG